MKMPNKGPKKQRPVPAKNLDDPVFVYTSACCGVRANKPALTKTPKAEGTLGSWRCSQCGKPCKCSRAKYKTPEAQ